MAIIHYTSSRLYTPCVLVKVRVDNSKSIKKCCVLPVVRLEIIILLVG